MISTTMTELLVAGLRAYKHTHTQSDNPFAFSDIDVGLSYSYDLSLKNADLFDSEWAIRAFELAECDTDFIGQWNFKRMGRHGPYVNMEPGPRAWRYL